jgi:hypothetical protein
MVNITKKILIDTLTLNPLIFWHWLSCNTFCPYFDKYHSAECVVLWIVQRSFVLCRTCGVVAGSVSRPPTCVTASTTARTVRTSATAAQTVGFPP